MRGAVDCAAYGGNVGDDTGRGFVVDDADRLDRALLVGRKLRFDRRCIGAVTPIAGQKSNDEAEALGEALPERREMSGLGHQHVIARRERVDERSFPCAGPGSGIDDDVSLCLEYALHPGKHAFREHGELGAAMVDRRLVDCAQYAVGHIRRSRDLQEVTA